MEGQTGNDHPPVQQEISRMAFSAGAVTKKQMERLIEAQREATLSPETRRILNGLILELSILPEA